MGWSRISTRGGFGLLCLLAAALGAGQAFAEGDALVAPTPRMITYQGASKAIIEHWIGQLGQADQKLRAQAHEHLTSLGEASLPGIEAALDELTRRRPGLDETRSAFAAIRHAVGSRRADDEIDIAPGVLKVLMHDRSRAVIAVAAPLLLLRSLERIATPRALHQAVRLLTIDDGLFRHELRQSRRRMGIAALPGLIELRSEGTPESRRWARRGVRALGMQDPKDALHVEDPYLVARVIEAYTNPLDFNALPELVKLVAHPKLQVRDAARAAMERSGRNAIWKLREQYEERSGKQANRGWSAERTAQELYAVIDGSAVEAAETRLAKGLAALERGDLAGMQAQYDLLLLKMPDFPQRAKMAPGYAALGEQLIASDRLQDAYNAYGRALRLAPEAKEARHWRGQRSFLSAEIALSRGVVDLDGYARALAHDPDHRAALLVAEQLSGVQQARVRKRKQWAAGAAAMLLLAVALMLLRGAREEHERDQREAPMSLG